MIEISGYHGSKAGTVAHLGFCLTDDDIAAENYAAQNAGYDEPVVYTVTIAADLSVADVDYDYDSGEPVLADCDADIACYEDCDETGRTHTTWMLLTPAAVAATTIA